MEKPHFSSDLLWILVKHNIPHWIYCAIATMLCVFGVLYALYVAMIIMCFSSSTIRDGAATRIVIIINDCWEYIIELELT